jgi:ABC-type amino acid transport substrate-binding protein
MLTIGCKLGVVLWIFGVLQGCTFLESPVEDGAGKLRVGIAADYPPIAYVEDGELKGIEVDLLKRMEETLGATFKVQRMDWEKLIPALNGGEVDVIMGGISITDERRNAVLFTDSYMRIGQMALIRFEDVGRLTPVSKIFSGIYKVGVQKNTTGAFFAKDVLAHSVLFEYDSIDVAVLALLNHEIDYFIHDAPTIWRYTTGVNSNKRLFGLYEPLTDEYLAWGVRSRDLLLKSKLNKALATIKDQGQLEAIINRWIKVSVEVKASKD